MSASKQCRDCKRTLPTTEFHRNKAKKDGLRDKCKKCAKTYHREHYLKNKETYVNASRDRRNRLREDIAKLKQQPCADCGAIWPPVAMDFDHVVDDKIACVATLVHKGSRNKVMEELKKCEVVCACCHRLRTHKRDKNGYGSGSLLSEYDV